MLTFHFEDEETGTAQCCSPGKGQSNLSRGDKLGWQIGVTNCGLKLLRTENFRETRGTWEKNAQGLFQFYF